MSAGGAGWVAALVVAGSIALAVVLFLRNRRLEAEARSAKGLADRVAREAGVRIGSARGDAERETRQLSALMAQMSQGVVLCDPEGTILVCNARAGGLLEDAGRLAPGQSAYAFLDANLVRHGLEAPEASVVTATRSGRLVRIRATRAGHGGDGFVLLIEDVTDTVEAAGRVEMLLHGLEARARAALASQRAALEALEAAPELPADARARFMGIIAEEAGRLEAAVEAADREFATARLGAWPHDAMAAGDLLAAAARRIESKLGIPTVVDPVDAGLWLRADGYSLLQALACLASRLRYELRVDRIRLAAARDGNLVRLTLHWPGSPLALDTWRSWESQSLRLGGEASPFSLAEILSRHGAEAWQRYDAGASGGVIELALPVREGPL